MKSSMSRSERQRSPDCSRGSHQLARMRTHAKIVRAYITRKRVDAAAELQSYATLQSIKAVIQFAALCQDPRTLKRHPHQRRIPQQALVQARDRLLKADLGECRTFHQLLEEVDKEIGGIDGIGTLTVYDISTRLGAFLQLEPDRVYLHCGTRDGARHLLPVAGRTWIWPNELPTAFSALRPRELEDCLCIFKKQLKELAKRPT